MIDLDKIRRDTRGCHTVTHFDNAGAALMPNVVIEAVKNHLDLEATIGGYAAANQAKADLEKVYLSAALLLGAQPDEIAIHDSATRAWCSIFYSFAFRSGDEIITTASEYSSSYLSFLQVTARTGARIVLVPSTPAGSISLEHLEKAVNSRTKLISLAHIATNNGLIQPAEAVGAIARAHGVPYLLDACQSAGQLDLNVERLGCDALTTTGRKYLRGPRGTGILFVKGELMRKLEPYVLDHHSAHMTTTGAYAVREDARRFEQFECNVAAKLGLGASIDYALSTGLDEIEQRVRHLAEIMRSELLKNPLITLHDRGEEKCGIVTFTVNGHASESVKQMLTQEKINVSVSAPSGAPLDKACQNIGPVIRASVHYYNTEEEIRCLSTALRKLDGP